MRVVAARPLQAGLERTLSARDLLTFCQDDDDDDQVVCVEPAADGRLPADALRARLAPHAPAQSLLLECAGAGAALRLRLATPPPRAGAELRVWPAHALLLAARVPFLLPRHIRGWCSYVCDVCGTSFPEPNPLKVHLFLRCGQPSRARFWRELLTRLAAPAPAPAPLPAVRGHRCGYCGRVYSRRYGLRIHTRTHTGHKPLRCGTCARAFADPSNLNKHVRLHKARAAAAAAEL